MNPHLSAIQRTQTRKNIAVHFHPLYFQDLTPVTFISFQYPNNHEKYPFLIRSGHARNYDSARKDTSERGLPEL